MNTLINLLPKEKSYLLAFSAGVDSTVMRHLLQSRGFDFKCVYFNHGKSKISNTSNGELDYITSTYKDCIVYDIHYSDISKGYESTARNQRYQQLVNVAMSEKRSIITAHHKSDNVETFLFRLFRNSGLNGLSKMKFHSTMHGVDIFRPLINSSKIDIIKYAHKKRLSWIEDVTNKNNDISRNLIRNEILPYLNRFFTDVESKLDSVSENLSNANELMTDLIVKTYDCNNLSSALERKYFKLILNTLVNDKYGVSLSSKDLMMIDQLLYTNQFGIYTVYTSFLKLTFNTVGVNNLNILEIKDEYI